MPNEVNESQFYMWRTLFAIAHADNVITEEEERFMNEVLETEPFTSDQRDTLRDDVTNAKNIIKMFRCISDKDDQALFFKFAKKLVWADGDYAPEEREVLLQLQSEHIKGVNVDDLVGSVALELDEDDDARIEKISGSEDEGRGIRSLVYSFRETFLKDRFG